MPKQFSILVFQPDDSLCAELELELSRAHLTSKIMFVNTQNEVISYLIAESYFSERRKYPLPSLMMLALDLRREDDCALIKTIKELKSASHIPIIVMSNGFDSPSILKAYRLGVNSVIRCPLRFESIVEIMSVLEFYWLETVRLPGSK